jgi:hypothetical protein
MSAWFFLSLSLSLSLVWVVGREQARFLEEHTEREEEDKYRCVLCSKRFRGADFTHKHLLGKHADALATRTALVCARDPCTSTHRRPPREGTRECHNDSHA